MFRKLMVALALAIFVAILPPALAAPQPTAKIDKITIRLLYKTTGTFSQDIADPAGFTGWNTIIAGGDAKEPADDLLVQVHLTMKPEEGNLAGTVTVDVTGERSGNANKPGSLGRHSCTGIYYKDGRSVCTLLVRNATCSGRVTVRAAIGRTERKSTGATLNCGE